MIVTVIASVAGLVNHNGMYYPPSALKAAANRWTDTYPRPMLLHHDESGECIGRAVGARYVDYTKGGRGKRSSATPLLMVMTDAARGAAAERGQTFALLKHPDVANQRKNPGLGHLEVDFKVDDVWADKFRNKIFLTGSMGFDTDSVTCPCCNNGFFSRECEHYPGDMYDGVLCAPVAGDISPREYSIVNTPAIEASQVVDIVEMQPSAGADAAEESEMTIDDFLKPDVLSAHKDAVAKALGLVDSSEVSVLQAQCDQLRAELALADTAARQSILADLGIVAAEGAAVVDTVTQIRDHFSNLPAAKAKLPDFQGGGQAQADRSSLEMQMSQAYASGQLHLGDALYSQLQSQKKF